jgi:UDP-N-acetylglucosamine acyltransferase
MTTSSIHATAIIDTQSQLGTNVSVGAYSIIEAGVIVGDGSSIDSHAILKKSTLLGQGVRVGHFSVVGGDPQHLSFDPDTPSGTVLGDGTRLGEGVTVHRSMYENGRTVIGRECFLMGYSHIAHDCQLGDKTILANGALLGGHVSLGSDVFVGGGAGLHQFVRVGEGAMIGGLAEVSADVPPQVTVSGRNRACGLNLVGLKRREATRDERTELKECYREILMKNGDPVLFAKGILDGPSPPKTLLGRSFAEFFLQGDRGFVRSQSSQ